MTPYLDHFICVNILLSRWSFFFLVGDTLYSRRTVPAAMYFVFFFLHVFLIFMLHFSPFTTSTFFFTLREAARAEALEMKYRKMMQDSNMEKVRF